MLCRDAMAAALGGPGARHHSHQVAGGFPAGCVAVAQRRGGRPKRADGNESARAGNGAIAAQDRCLSPA